MLKSHQDGYIFFDNRTDIYFGHFYLLRGAGLGEDSHYNDARRQSLAVIFPQFSSLDAKIMIEKEVLPEQEFVRNEFKEFGLNPAMQIVSIEPTEAEIRQAVNLAKNSDLTILFCFDAHLYPSNKKLLDAVQDAAKELVVDLLRDPYDAAAIKAGVACLTDFGWRACQIKAAIEKMCASPSALREEGGVRVE